MVFEILEDVFMEFAQPVDIFGFFILEWIEHPLARPGRIDTALNTEALDQIDKAEASRALAALTPFVERGVPVIGLEPSCLFTFRDEIKAMLPGAAAENLSNRAMLFEEFLASEHDAGRLSLDLAPIPYKKALLHGHCHQKAFAVMGAVQSTLSMIPDLEVETIQSSCCGMAGAFGYEADNYDISMKMAEADLLPAVRNADSDTVIVADGTSCRHQIKDGADREALSVARLLESALKKEK